MGQIVISENVTVDGVMQDPTGEEGSRFGGWFRRIGDGDREAWTRIERDEAMRSAALLLGRRSCEWFAERWMPRTGDWADRLNSMPKYVVSSTADEPGWNNATVLNGDVIGRVTALRDELAGDIVVYGSGRLVRTLLAHDLVDELRLMVFPFVLGDGRRLFGEATDLALHLVESRVVGDSLVQLTYQRA